MTDSTRIDLLDSIKQGLIRLRSTKTTAIKSLQNQIVPIDRWPLLVCKRRFRVPRQVAEQLLIQQTALLFVAAPRFDTFVAATSLPGRARGDLKATQRYSDTVLGTEANQK